MPYAYLKYPDGRLEFVEIITLSPGSPPPRPHPQPPLGIWGPGDPRPTNPIAGFDPIHGTWPEPPVGPGGPVDPGYSPPWAQIPVDPGYGIPIGGAPGRGTGAVVFPAPVTDPPAVPPEGMAADSKQVLIWFGPGTMPAMAWVSPYAAQTPKPA